MLMTQRITCGYHQKYVSRCAPVSMVGVRNLGREGFLSVPQKDLGSVKAESGRVMLYGIPGTRR